MTVICVSPPSLTVRHSDTKPSSAHSSTHRAAKVRFNDRVRLRRTAIPQSFAAIWYTEDELLERRRKDKKLRYAIAKQPNVFGSEKLLTLGLHTEEERRLRGKRALAARSSVLSSSSFTMEVDSSSSDSDDASSSSSSSYSNANYSHHSQLAAVEARQRALQHAAHVQTMMEEEDDDVSSSQEFSVTTLEMVASPTPSPTKAVRS